MNELEIIVLDKSGATTAEMFDFSDAVEAAEWIIRRAAELYSSGWTIVEFSWKPAPE